MSFLYGSSVSVAHLVLGCASILLAAAPLDPSHLVGRPLEDLRHRPACPVGLHLLVGRRRS